MLPVKDMDDKKLRSKPLIILGMHRSGTSLVVRLLTEIGIHMGSWLSRDAESIHFMGLNKRVFKDANSDWAEIDPLMQAIQSENFVKKQAVILQKALFNENLTDFVKHFNPFLKAEAIRLALLDDPQFVRQNNLIAVFFGRQLWNQILRGIPVSWGWKDPRNTLTFPIWLNLFPRARVLHILRNGIDVAISTHRRSQKQQQKIYKRWFPIDYSQATLDFEYCFRLWERHVTFVMNHRQPILPGHYLEIRYEDLLANPHDHLRKIASFINHSVDEDVLRSACDQVDQSRLDNSIFARPYLDQIPELAKSPIMEYFDYSYALSS